MEGDGGVVWVQWKVGKDISGVLIGMAVSFKDTVYR